MVNKTIKDRGFTTTTLPAPETFSFSQETRQLELIYYYQYCVNNNLITVTGEQSRTALILKTFNHKILTEFDILTGYSESGYSEEGYGRSFIQLGGYGYSDGGYGEYGYNEISYLTNAGQNTLWSDAMRDWLKTAIPSGLNDLSELWIVYFTKYATTPDLQNITYAGLSMEDAYRRFLIRNISGNAELFPVFSDQMSASDLALFELKKFLNDEITLGDSAVFQVKLQRLFNDSVDLTDSALFAQKMLFSDSTIFSDEMLIRFTKRFADTINLIDNYSFIRIINRAFSDTISPSDALRIILTNRLDDAVTLDDALKLIYKSTYSDEVSISDSLKYIITPRLNDAVYVTDTAIFTLTP